MSWREKFQKAIETVKKGTEEDKRGNYEDALKYYKLAGDYFVFAIKYETTNEKEKESIRRTFEPYLKRAEVIHNLLQQKDKQAPILNGENGKTNLPNEHLTQDENLRQHAKDIDFQTHLKDMKRACETQEEVLSQVKAFQIKLNEIGSAVEDLRTQKKTESEDKDRETKDLPHEEGSGEQTKLMGASVKSSKELEPKLQEHVPRPEEKRELDEKSTPLNSVGNLNNDNPRENDKSFHIIGCWFL